MKDWLTYVGTSPRKNKILSMAIVHVRSNPNSKQGNPRGQHSGTQRLTSDAISKRYPETVD